MKVGNFILSHISDTFQSIKQPKNRHRFLAGISFQSVAMNISRAGQLAFTSYMIYLGFNESQMGIIISLLGFSQMLQFLSSILYERFSHPKRIILTLKVIRSTLLLLVAFVPLLFPVRFHYFFFFLLCLLRGVSENLVGGGYLEWTDRYVPSNMKGRYYAIRNTLFNATFMVISLCIGAILDRYDGVYVVYIFILLFGSLCGFIEVFILSKIPYGERSIKTGAPITSVIFAPLKDKKYRQFLLFTFLWMFSTNMGMSYLTIYAVKYMAYSYSFIATTFSCSAFVKMIVGPLWGRQIDFKSPDFVIFITACGFTLTVFSFLFLSATAPWIYSIVIIANGIFMIGFNVAKYNVDLRLSKGPLRNAYLSMGVTITGLGTFVSIYICSQLVHLLANINLQLFRYSLNIYQLMFLAASILHLIALYYFISFIYSKPKKSEVI